MILPHRPLLSFLCAGLCATLSAAPALAAEIHPGMLRNADVSATQICFVYNNDVWVAPKEGGIALPLSSPAGEEQFPRFSPDGTKIAFSASYDGHQDVYELPVGGGVPKRLTTHPGGARMTDYAPDGRVVFSSFDMATGTEVVMWYADPQGGLPQRLPLKYGDMASFFDGGRQIAFTPYRHIWQDDSWNRYQGGQAADVWTFNLETKESRQLTNWPGTDDTPMADGERVFYLSDAGPEHRRNIWLCNLADGKCSQVTHFRDSETRWPAIGPQDIVFQNGGRLWRMPLDTLEPAEIKVSLSTDLPNLRPRTLTLEGMPQAVSLSPQARRLAIEQRGDIWTIPAKEGYPVALTPTDGVAERDPSWSPDGRWIAYISDESDHYEIYVRSADGKGSARQITSGSPSRMQLLTWSPDSTKIAYTDRSSSYYVVDVAEGGQKRFAEDSVAYFGGWTISWSPDSRWIAYNIYDGDSSNSVIHIYDTQEGRDQRVTSPAFEAYNPAFDMSGDFLYYTSNQHFEPIFSDVDDWDTFLFANSTMIACAPLRRDVKSPFLPRNDDEADEEEKAEKEKKDEAPPAEAAPEAVSDTASAEAAPVHGAEAAPSAPAPGEPPAPKPVLIDFEGLEGRAVPLPIEAGNIGSLTGGQRRLFYVKFPRSGAGEAQPELHSFDLAAVEAKDPMNPPDQLLQSGIGGYILTPDASQLLVIAQGAMFIVPAAPGAPLAQPVPLPALTKELNPRNEWRQMIIENYRLFKEEFYDPGLHGVDWEAARDRALALLPYAGSTEDVGYIIAEMNGEMNVGHSYVSPGSSGHTPGPWIGVLGCDFEPAEDSTGQRGIRISRIYSGADFELGVRGPLSQPGVDVKEGQFLLAVNDVELEASRSPFEYLTGQAGQTVKLTIGDRATRDDSTRDVLVTAMGWDGELRHRDWVEKNRRYVYEKSGGRVGYIHVRDTGGGGLIDLQRQFLGQHNMDALIIDERYNGGGFIAHRFIELLNRPVRMYDAMHYGKGMRTPRRSAPGAKVMLVNQYAGSGGDGFPWLFRDSGLGPIVGVRTWGGFVGIWGPKFLLDGTVVYVPAASSYEADSTWIIEGYGIDPDVVVVNDPTSLARGLDLQLDKSIEVALAEAVAHPWSVPPRPAPLDRSGAGTQPDER